MNCSKCGEEISDYSDFCSSCGSKIHIKKEQKTVSESPPSFVDVEKYSTKNSEQKISEKEVEQVVSPTELTPTPKKTKKGFGFVILLMFYGFFLVNLPKFNSYFYTLTITTLFIIILLGLIFLPIIYFWLRSLLLKKEYFRQIPTMTSIISGVISYFLIGILVSGSVSFVGDYQKDKEKNEFITNFGKQLEILQKKELEFTKTMMLIPKTKLELQYRIREINDYKKFYGEERNNFNSLINLLREMNSRYKKDNEVTEKINKLESDVNELFKSSEYGLEMYRNYLIKGKDEYWNEYNQILIKQPTLRTVCYDETRDILKSL